MCRITCLFQFLLVIVFAANVRNQDFKHPRHRIPQQLSHTNVLDNGADINCNFDNIKLPEGLEHVTAQVSNR